MTVPDHSEQTDQWVWLARIRRPQGRTARSVRTILGAVSMKLHRRFTLDILEEDEL